jgi:serine/threonine protein kinase
LFCPPAFGHRFTLTIDVFKTSVLKRLDLDFRYCEDIVAFVVGEDDRNRGPLPNDGLRRFFVSIQKPSMTLTSIVRGMLRNARCQTDSAVRHRYSMKVFDVLRMIAHSLQWLHRQGFVHGNLSLETCGKFESNWKLVDILGVQKIGDFLDKSRLSISAPPEAVKFSPIGSPAQRYELHDNYVAHPSLDVWAFGKLSFEVLVGKPLILLNKNDNFDRESWMCLRQWSDFNLHDVRRQLEHVGISAAGVGLIVQCLSPTAVTRPGIDEVLQHSVWSERNTNQ